MKKPLLPAKDVFMILATSLLGSVFTMVVSQNKTLSLIIFTILIMGFANLYGLANINERL